MLTAATISYYAYWNSQHWRYTLRGCSVCISGLGICCCSKRIVGFAPRRSVNACEFVMSYVFSVVNFRPEQRTWKNVVTCSDLSSLSILHSHSYRDVFFRKAHAGFWRATLFSDVRFFTSKLVDPRILEPRPPNLVSTMRLSWVKDGFASSTGFQLKVVETQLSQTTSRNASKYY